ncbi:MAG: hypothetical protein HQ596_01335 [Candidatus Saganbacteria bacterium]|nr:hypothetical protein [Candidatus Saganbacteria bacterium]
MIGINVMNVILCVLILVLGVGAYQKDKNKVALYVGIAFALFGISHIAWFFGLEQAWSTLFIIIRTLGYLLVVFALLKSVTKA